MKIDLGNHKTFHDDEIIFDKNINFIFGKNGTGKTSITDLIQQQYRDDFDIRVFQGFNKLLGEDKKLNAVVLGEENNSINQQIKTQTIELEKITSEIETLKNGISEPKNKEDNIYTRLNQAECECSKKDSSIEKFYTQAASSIAKDSSLVENARNYNKNHFKGEIEQAKLLDETEIERNKEILKSSKKIAQNITFPDVDFLKYQRSVNEILVSMVESKIVIEELNDDSQKSNFAQQGLHLHEVGDKCSFCGNIISQDRMKNLKSYFSADEVENLKKRISDGKRKIDKYRNGFNSMSIDIGDFYPDYLDSIKQISEEFHEIKTEQIKFMDALYTALDNKEKNLFEITEKLDLMIPAVFDEVNSEYQKVVSSNNEFSENLVEKQKDSRTSLRLHAVKDKIDEFELNLKKNDLNNSEKKVSDIKNEEKIELEKIAQKQNDEQEIIEKIRKLKSQTKNTEKLALNINEKLKYSVTFELFRKEDDGQEFYEIKDGEGNTRPITQLSTGERNIIAFLYFIDKLSEITDDVKIKDKIVIFDDPMNSNDDTMQFLIIDELQRIIKKCAKKTNNDKFILLTHNVFFYLNCSYDIKNNRNEKVDVFEENNFYRLLRSGKNTKINKIENRQQDFKTNYEALWHELVFLYSEKKSEMMLNPIRRIIETYVVFNGKEDFYKDNKDAKNLFNTNSHYFPDLEADLNGKTHEDIKNMMEKCFNDNGEGKHFKKHWKNASKSVKV